MKRRILQLGGVVWSTNLVILCVSMFSNRFGQGLLGGARTNFFVDTLGITGQQILALEGIREIPGLALIFLAALTMRFSLPRRAAVSVFIMGVGYILFATVHSYSALLVVAVLASLGMHLWMPLSESLAMALGTKETSGRIMGTLQSVGALAAIAGMGVLALISALLPDLELGLYYVFGGILILVAAVLLWRLPKDLGDTKVEPPRMLVSKRYWLYYVLTFFQGSRKQVLNTFGLLVLVEIANYEVWQISLLLLISGVVNLIGAPLLGSALDHFGERRTLSISYALLVLCCLVYAFIHQAWILAAVLVLIKLLSLMGVGLSTYVNRIAPEGELTPTLSAGISINHITSVGMPMVAAAVLPLIGYDGIFLGTAGLILLSIPFAMMIRVPKETTAAATT